MMSLAYLTKLFSTVKQLLFNTTEISLSQTENLTLEFSFSRLAMLILSETLAIRF